MKFVIYIGYFFRSLALRGLAATFRLLKAEMTYDKKFAIKTSAIKKSESAEFFHYQGAGYQALFEVLKDVYKSTGTYAFTDIGCGKGRAVFVAEYCGYNRLTGIELHRDLVEEAQHNLATYAFKRKGSEIDFVTANALDVTYKDEPTVYFLFNPFNEAVMRQVLNKIVASTRSDTWFVYMNPLYTAPFLENNMELVKEYKTGRYREALVFRKKAM